MALKVKAKSALERFTPAPHAALPRIIGCSAGEVGTGKTHFWLTAPGPIVVMSFDQGLEGVVEPFTEHKEVRVAEYDWSPADEDFTQDHAIDLRNRFIADFIFACEHARTVLWDKETDVWELFRYAEFGGPSDRPNNYAELNQRVRKWINYPKKLAINFGCIQSLKDEWVTLAKADGREKGSFSGNRVRQGFKELSGLVHVDLFHHRKGGVFSVTIGKVRGQNVKGITDCTFDDLDIPTLGQMIHPSTEESDWV